MKKMVLGAMALLCLASPINAQNSMKTKEPIKQTACHNNLGEFAPEFAHLNDDILFGEVWNQQDELSLHDRSLVTIISLMSQGLTDLSFRHHLENAKAHGVSRQEISEVITHTAFYAGWPKAWAAFCIAKEVWTDDAPLTKDEFQMSTPYPVGEPNTANARYFKGNSYLAPMDAKGGGPINVTFEPACRNNWHVHHGFVQVLICVAGRGWYQEWGKPAVEIRPGSVITIPKGVKHWHGAVRDSWFQHLTYHAKDETKSHTEWLEPVAADDYEKLP
ncbi:carboxymuconolactone decarboxylase family protein [Porphyromonas sp.]